MCRRRGLDVPEQGQLEVDFFRSGLDHDVGVPDGVGHHGREPQAPAHRIGVCIRQLAELNALANNAIDGGLAPVDRGLRDVVEHGVVAGGHRRVGDAVPHGAGPENRDLPDECLNGH